jgi:hypothetical protein
MHDKALILVGKLNIKPIEGGNQMTEITRKPTPPRAWEIDDLLDLGKREGIRYLKAVPVLVLEEWLLHGEGKDDVYVRTKALARRLVDTGLHAPFPSKGTSNILAALSAIQKDRNLTKPPLMKIKDRGAYWVNINDYKDLLEKFRKIYRDQCPEDYKKLFQAGEPNWQPFKTVEFERRETNANQEKSDAKDEIQILLAQVEKALRDKQQAIERLSTEKQKLEAGLIASQASLQEKRMVPYREIVDEELRLDCEELLGNPKTYIDAIRRAGVVLETRIKKAIGIGDNELQYGTGLIKSALASNTGMLMISESPNEQEGVFQLFTGAMAFVRNPPAHKKVQYTEREAWQTISLIDYLLMLLGQAKPRK